MRQTIFEVAAAVAAAAIVLLVAAVSGSLHGSLRWLLVIAVALVACIAAWLAARRISPAQVSGVEVGNRIRSKANVDIRDVSVGPTGENVSVGNDIRSKRSARLRGITVGKIRRPSK
jgi:ABC-type nickel/cobalt efflux system permease component RcnA